MASPLSANSLREDLEVSHGTVTRWLGVLDRLFHTYDVRPFGASRVRALRKMPKVYLWDWSLVEKPGPRFENLVASQLLRLCQWLTDRDGHRAELHYLRDRTGHEVDFVVTVDRKPWFAVEATVGDTTIDPSLRYFRERVPVPFWFQVVLGAEADYEKDGIRVVPAGRFLAALV